MTRQTFNYNGLPYCGEVSGSLPGNLTITGATAGACSTNPPPGNDAQAIETARVTFFGSPQTIIASCNMRSADEFFGRLFAQQPSIAFPWASPTVGLQVPANRKIRARFTVPQSCPNTVKMIRLNNYHGATLIPARMAIVPAGADWPPDTAQADGSYKRNLQPGGNASLQLSCGYPPSTGRAEVVRGQSYDFLFAFEDGHDADAYADGGYVVFSL